MTEPTYSRPSGWPKTAEAAQHYADMLVRPSAKAVYDSRESGDQYHVTYRLDDRTVTFQQPIADPFVRATLHVSWLDRLKSLLRRDMTVTVLVGATSEVTEAVLELDDNYRGVPGSERRAQADREIRQSLVRFGKETEAAEHDGAR